VGWVLERINFNIEALGSSVLAHAPTILIAIAIFVIGRWLARRLGRAAENAFNKSPNADASLSRFFASLIRYLILLATVIAALTFLGVDTTSISGMVLGLGVAMAFILKDALSDVAAGVMMMIFRPYNVGDEVEIDGTKGVVKSIELTATRMHTRNNVELIVQNGKAWGGVIRNHNALGDRRLDIDFGVSYDADINKAIKVITETAAADPRVYSDPAPWAKVVSLGESSVDIQLRAWCEYDNLRKLKMDISQPIKQALEKAGIGIPYPHEIKIKQKVKSSKARNRIKKLKKLRNA
jgi:small conductance mechanosensitive channel